MTICVEAQNKVNSEALLHRDLDFSVLSSRRNDALIQCEAPDICVQTSKPNDVTNNLSHTLSWIYLGYKMSCATNSGAACEKRDLGEASDSL